MAQTETDERTASMREKHGLGGMLVGATLASIQLNLFLGVPAYLVSVAVSKRLTLLPDSPLEILVLLGCMAPVFLFVVWSASTEMPRALTIEEAPIQRTSAGEFDEAFASVIRPLTEPPERLTGSERALRDSMDQHRELMDKLVPELARQLRHLSPDEAFSAAKKQTSDSGIAMGVRYAVWELQLHDFDEQAFLEQSRLVNEEEAMTVDFPRKLAAIYIERARRGLPLPELPSSGEAFARWSRMNSQAVASGQFDEETRRRLGQAEAVWKMASAHDRLNGDDD